MLADQDRVMAVLVEVGGLLQRPAEQLLARRPVGTGRTEVVAGHERGHGASLPGETMPAS